MTRLKLSGLLSILVITLGACGASDPIQDDPARMLTLQQKRATGEDGMVVAAHPEAVSAGLEMLERDGNAVDAAVASAFALAVVEPMMSGLGGSGAMTIWNNEQNRPAYLDFYAQLGEDPDYELDQDSENDTEVSRERIVAVPGFVKGLLEAHRKEGTLDRQTVMEPAITLARDGFPVHGLLGEIIRDYEERLTYEEAAAGLFYPEGEPVATGETLIQEDLAGLLSAIAEQGAQAFYNSEFTENVVEDLQEGGSTLTVEDFAGYEARWRGALCGTYKDYKVVTAPPPLAGTEVIQTLNMLEYMDPAADGLPFNSGAAAKAFADAFRMSQTDRRRWTGDPLFFDLPTAGLISKAYAEHRADQIDGVAESVEAGDPWPFIENYDPACSGEGWHNSRSEPTREWEVPEAYMPEMQQPEEQHTTHLSVIDGDGNTVSMTNTMGLYFGSAVFKEGVFFNSANRNVGDRQPNIRVGGRTAHSSTAPTILLEEEEPVLAVGSPGSGRIPPAIVSMTLYTLEYELDPAVAIGLPRLYPFRSSPILQTEGGFTPDALEILHEYGYDIRPNPSDDRYFGGVHLILRDLNGKLIGAADPRRDGVVKSLNK